MSTRRGGCGLATTFGFGAGNAPGSAICGGTMSEGALDAKAWRSGSLRPATVCGGSATATVAATASLSALPSQLETGPWGSDAAAISSRAPGTLLRPRMLVAAAPTMRKQVSAMIVMARVTQFSVAVDPP